MVEKREQRKLISSHAKGVKKLWICIKKENKEKRIKK